MIDIRRADENIEQEADTVDIAEESTRIKKQRMKDRILEKVD